MKLLPGVCSFPSAVFSECGRYRYTLWRSPFQAYVPDKYVNFICLNPSTATDAEDDPTVRKCQTLARNWGYEMICITNIFAYRSTDPSLLKSLGHEQAVGDNNNELILVRAQEAALVVCAWGAHGDLYDRAKVVEAGLRRHKIKLHYLKLGAKQPWHPLYLKNDTLPQLWV